MLAEQQILERVARGELELRPKLQKKLTPRIDYRGNICTYNDNAVVLDHSINANDPRHTVAKLHRHLTDKGLPGFSGLYDPKVIRIDNIKYQILPHAHSICELCEAGDMIPPWERFMWSKYKPTPWAYFKGTLGPKAVP
jgi:hypothetical protein